jgi:DNA-binding Xre family transcriptional regulator
MNLGEKLMSLSGGETSDVMEKIKYRVENRAWLRKSSGVAIMVLSTLRSKKLTQAQLSERMGVSPQQVNKIVQGQENLTLETISKLEAALEIKIIDVLKPEKKPSGKKKPAA